MRTVREIALEEIHCALREMRFHLYPTVQLPRELMMCEVKSPFSSDVLLRLKWFHQKKGQRTKVVESAVDEVLRYLVFKPTILSANLSLDQNLFTKKGQKTKVVESAVAGTFRFLVFVPPSLAAKLKLLVKPDTFY